ncbi:MAG: DUF6607 family protein [Akkermansiaceae bacterium]
MKHTIISLISMITTVCSAQAQQSTQQKFEQDRKAILAMTGIHSVDFNFHEIYSLNKDYTIKESKYAESAHEVVFLVEDTGTQITLQHMLQVKHGDNDAVVKHWSQIWTYEDTEILEYQGKTTWNKITLEKTNVTGTWSQLVTQTNDSPRYESYATWTHLGGISEWVSKETARPLPRREYTKRKDYDILVARNSHIIAPNGWTHEQSNKKLVKRENANHYLALERGYNTYTKSPDFDVTAATTEWNETKEYWKEIRNFWNQNMNKNDTFSYVMQTEGTGIREALRQLIDQAKEDKKLTSEQVNNTLNKYLVK